MPCKFIYYKNFIVFLSLAIRLLIDINLNSNESEINKIRYNQFLKFNNFRNVSLPHREKDYLFFDMKITPQILKIS